MYANIYLLSSTESPTATTLSLIGHACGGLALPVHVSGACRQRRRRREWRTSQARGTITSPFFILHGGGGVGGREPSCDSVADAFAVACFYLVGMSVCVYVCACVIGLIYKLTFPPLISAIEFLQRLIRKARDAKDMFPTSGHVLLVAGLGSFEGGLEDTEAGGFFRVGQVDLFACEYIWIFN